MDHEFSEKIRKELEEITKKKGYLLGYSESADKTSLLIIDEFIKYNDKNVNIHKNLLSTLMLISNYLVNDSIIRIFTEVNPRENFLVLQLYMYLQMSGNFLDGFFLGSAFVKITENFDILEKQSFDSLEIFKQVYILRIQQKEIYLVELMDKDSGLINHFKNSYHDLFYKNSDLLKELADDNIQLVVDYLIMSFFDGIITAKIISEFFNKED